MSISRSGGVGARPRARRARVWMVAAVTLVANLAVIQAIGVQAAHADVVGFLDQDFNAAAPPALNLGWTASCTGSCPAGVPWLTQFQGTSNIAIGKPTNQSTDNSLVSPVFQYPTTAVLSFIHTWNFAIAPGASQGGDGGVLEMKVGSGAWNDITAAGGVFAANACIGGYNGKIKSTSSAINGRNAFVGQNGIGGGQLGCTRVALPAADAGLNVQLRWRIVSDNDGIGAAGTYWWIDEIRVLTTVRTVTLAPANGQKNPTSDSPINYTATFSDVVTGFDSSDILFNGSTAPGSLSAQVTGSGAKYNVAVSGMTGSGNVVATVRGLVGLDRVTDQGSYASSPATVTYTAPARPAVTIDQDAGQADPTNGSTITFDVAFDSPVSDFATGDVTLSGTAGATTADVSGQGKSYTVAVSGMTGSGTVIATIGAGVAHDSGGLGNGSSTSTDNTVVYDVTPPSVTINQASDQADPTNASPVKFSVVFSEPVTDFATGDVTLSGSAGATTATVSGSGTNYDVAVSGMTGPGTVTAGVGAGVAHDAVGNASLASTSADDIVTFDNVAPTVTIDQDGAQADPTGTPPVTFTVVFSEPVTGFATGDVTLSGSAGATTATVTGAGANYSVAVTGMSATGTVIATIGAGVAQDLVGNANAASTSTDNTVTFSYTRPSVTVEQAAGQADPTNTFPIHFTVTFSSDVPGLGSGNITTNEDGVGQPPVVTGGPRIYDVSIDNGFQLTRVKVSIDAGSIANNFASTSVDNEVTVGTNGAACSYLAAVGPPKHIDFTVQSSGSGLASIQVTTAVNVVQPITINFTPGTTSPVNFSVVKDDQTKPSAVAIVATDMSGYKFSCT